MPGFRRRRIFRRRRPTFRKTRRAFPVRSRRMVRRPRVTAAASMGSTTWIMNPRRPRGCRVEKTLLNYASFSGGVGSDASTSWIIDPSGTYDTNSKIMQNWSQYSALYDQYRVNTLTVICRIIPGNVNVLPDNVTIYMRYNYDDNISATQAEMSRLSRVKCHTFTTEHPTVTYKLYPKVANTIRNSTAVTLANQTEQMIRCPWVDTDRPVNLYGFLIVVPSFPANVVLQFDMIYDVSFRYQV